MLRYMERSTIHFLKHKGWTNVQIAEFTGHHRDTIAKVLKEAVEKKPHPRQRSSAVDVFRPQIASWLEQNLPVIRMLELAREDHDHAYSGSETAFYDYVRKMRRARQQTPRNVALRFEGVPGEYVQIDWGEVRNFPFSKAGMENQTRYFFAARLKYSRYMYVSFHTDMREETLLRCLIACFEEIDGVPWAVVTDNMKTAVLGRTSEHEPIWNPAYQKLAVEFQFHPDVCAPASGNQKGAVENLVKFVKGNFLPARSFYDDADLAEQCRVWLRQVNTERPSDATGQAPAILLEQEQPQFGPLPQSASDYGFFDSVVVSREGLVAVESNRYSVPAHLIGRVLTARIHQSRIELFADGERVASHPRHPGQHARIIDPTHFEAVFATKPRGRVMVYRDWLCDLAPAVASYVRELCHKRRAEMNAQMLALYELAQESGKADFVAALELAAEQQMYGAEYVRAIVSLPGAGVPKATVQRPLSALLPAVPTQQEIERDLANYEQYVANREQLPELVGSEIGGGR
jgi:transposase